MKNLLLVLLVGTVAFEGYAQDQAVGPKLRKKFRIGFNLSPSIDFFQPNTEGVSSEAVKAKFGYGMMAEYAFTNNYAIAFGLEHKMAGAALDFRDGDVRYFDQSDKGEYQLNARTYRYDYVIIPITLKLMTNEIGYFTYFGQFGADISVLAAAKVKDERRAVADTSTIPNVVSEVFGDIGETDFTGRYDQAMFINVRLRIGAGFEWNFSGNTSLVVSVSYHNGFIDLMRDPDSDKVGLYRYDDARNRVPFEMSSNLHHVALNVGVLF